MLFRRIQIKTILTAVLALYLVAGCGGGGDGDGTPAPNQANVIAGYAAKEATVTLFSILADGSKGEVLGTDITGLNGYYAINVGAYTGAVLIESTGGSYKDMATGASIPAPNLRAALGNVSGSVEIAVTPLTEIAVRQAASSLTVAAINQANAQVSAMLGGLSITAVMPADVTDSASTTATQGQKEYGILLAAISQMMLNDTLSLEEVMENLRADLADGNLDTTGQDLILALDAFLANPYNLSGVSDKQQLNFDEGILDLIVNPRYFSVSFNSNGGSPVGGIIVEFGATIAAPTAPTRVGHAFAGWHKDSALTSPWIFATDTVPAAATILYAKWNVNQYTVSFESNGGSLVAGIVADYGSFLAQPAAPSRTGYTFGGWHKDEALTSAWNFGTDTVPAAAMTLYAKWTDNALNQYTISFNSNGGSAVQTIVTELGATIAAPADPTRTGHTFAGWYKDEALTNPWVFAVDTVPATFTTLYAQWTANQYTVSFNSNGGIAVEAIVTDYGSKPAAPTTPTQTGYTFAGWFKDTALITPWNFGVDAVLSNTTLYAKWTIDRYLVSFDSTSGSVVGAILATYGTTIAAPAAPTKAGFTFAGWYRDATLTSPWSFGTDLVLAPTTLYAKWTDNALNLYTVSFNSNGGSAVAPIVAELGGLIAQPAAPSRGGYTFAGWYKDAAFANAWNFGTDTVPAAFTTLYAKWNIVTTLNAAKNMVTGLRNEILSIYNYRGIGAPGIIETPFTNVAKDFSSKIGPELTSVADRISWIIQSTDQMVAGTSDTFSSGLRILEITVAADGGSAGFSVTEGDTLLDEGTVTLAQDEENNFISGSFQASMKSTNGTVAANLNYSSVVENTLFASMTFTGTLTAPGLSLDMSEGDRMLHFTFSPTPGRQNSIYPSNIYFSGVLQTESAAIEGVLDIATIWTIYGYGMDGGCWPIARPSNALFSGTLQEKKDELLTGVNLGGEIFLDWANADTYDGCSANGAANFPRWSASFSGAIESPQRPLMEAFLVVAQNELKTLDLHLNYQSTASDLSAVSFIGDGLYDDANHSLTAAIADQDGTKINFVYLDENVGDERLSGTIKSSAGAQMAIIYLQNGLPMVKYTDDYIESIF